jgi:hypothetical protein
MIIIFVIFITGLHKKPQGCGASVASAAGPFATKKKTASKENGLEVNAETMKCVFMSWKNNAGQNNNINVVDRSFENVINFSSLKTILPNQNYLHEKLKAD